MPEKKAPRKEQTARFWRWAVTMLGLVWNLVLPIVGGVLLGSYLDTRLGHGVAWTLGLLVVGVTISLYNLYHILVEQVQD
jgi:predicted F0F1-ATPase subunit